MSQKTSTAQSVRPVHAVPRNISFWRRHARTILAGALLLIGIHDILGPHGFLAMRRTQKEMDQLRSDVARLNKENSSMSDEAKSLKSDPQAIERIAREEMGLARPGEMIFKLPPPAPGQSGGAAAKPR
jgi:cell division protein FtsB